MRTSRINQYILTLALLLPFSLCGQTKKYSLDGRAKMITGETYPYHVVFDVKGTALSGYSITKQLNGTDYKTEIKGHIYKRTHTLTITETKPLGALPDSTGLCMFDARLTYKLEGARYVVTGKFTSKDISGNLCGEGTMRCEQLNTPASVFYTKPDVPKADTPVVKEPIPANTITEGVQKQIDWQTGECIMEIWDGGVVDGDVITILLNDIPVLTQYRLVKEKKQLRLPLAKKTNTITIIADDEGANPPNTADILLMDGPLQYKLTAYNSAGKRAVIVLTKR